MLSFLPRGHGNEFSNLIGSLRDPHFSIFAHGMGNAYVRFCPCVYKAFFFQNGFILDKIVEKQKLSFQNRLLLQY